MSIADEPGLTDRDRCVRLGLVGKTGQPMTSTLARVRDRLKAAKLVIRKHREWVLTSDGEDAVKALRSGHAGGANLDD